MTENDEYVLEVLTDVGLISDEQAAAAQEGITEERRTAVDVLVAERTITERDVLKCLASQFGMEVINLPEVEIPPTVIEYLPSEVAYKYQTVPVYQHDDTLTVAIGDPLNMDTLDSLRYVLKCNVEGVVAPPDEIKGALAKYYGDNEAGMAAMLDGLDDASVAMTAAGAEDLIEDAGATEADAPIIKLVSLIILEAFRKRASDIHLEPMEKQFRVRYRIDGVLHEVEPPPKRLQSAIISRIKIMANMKISEKRVPQDGRIPVNIEGHQLDLRVSSVPTTHAESIVMRILDKKNVAVGMHSLGFFADDQETFEELVTLPDGILLVTGPTGSGKTTTLYSCLNYINRPDRKIITVEDPVEYQLQGVNQVHVREDIGLTFAAALRSMLRQAPNIIMIGEIRDFETAEIAVHASLTGHLVFSTLHTNDAPSAVTRLLDIGVKPFLVASSLRAVMAQRLVRNICESCKEEVEPTTAQLQLLGTAAAQMSETSLFQGRGCPECEYSGYHGRKGIFEIFLVDDEVRHMIYQKVPASEMRVRCRELGMRTLREDGLRKVVAGVTTLDEVLRVTIGDEL